MDFARRCPWRTNSLRGDSEELAAGGRRRILRAPRSVVGALLAAPRPRVILSPPRRTKNLSSPGQAGPIEIECEIAPAGCPRAAVIPPASSAHPDHHAAGFSAWRPRPSEGKWRAGKIRQIARVDKLPEGSF